MMRRDKRDRVGTAADDGYSMPTARGAQTCGPLGRYDSEIGCSESTNCPLPPRSVALLTVEERGGLVAHIAPFRL